MANAPLYSICFAACSSVNPLVPTKLCLNVSEPLSNATLYTRPSPSKNWFSLFPKISSKPGPLRNKVPFSSGGITPVTRSLEMERGALPSVVLKVVLR
jgi:hypothetical protein